MFLFNLKPLLSDKKIINMIILIIFKGADLIEIDLKYAIFTCVLIGVLGGIVFFIWDLINNSFSVPHATSVAINATIIFAIIGFFIGLVTGNRK